MTYANYGSCLAKSNKIYICKGYHEQRNGLLMKYGKISELNITIRNAEGHIAYYFLKKIC